MLIRLWHAILPNHPTRTPLFPTTKRKKRERLPREWIKIPFIGITHYIQYTRLPMFSLLPFFVFMHARRRFERRLAKEKEEAQKTAGTKKRRERERKRAYGGISGLVWHRFVPFFLLYSTYHRMQPAAKKDNPETVSKSHHWRRCDDRADCCMFCTYRTYVVVLYHCLWVKLGYTQSISNASFCRHTTFKSKQALSLSSILWPFPFPPPPLALLSENFNPWLPNGGGEAATTTTSTAAARTACMYRTTQCRVYNGNKTFSVHLANINLQRRRGLPHSSPFSLWPLR